MRVERLAEQVGVHERLGAAAAVERVGAVGGVAEHEEADAPAGDDRRRSGASG